MGALTMGIGGLMMLSWLLSSYLGAKGEHAKAKVAAESQEKMLDKQLEMAGTLRERESEATIRALSATRRRTKAATKATAEAKQRAGMDALVMQLLPMLLQNLSTGGGGGGGGGGLPMAGDAMTSDQRAMGPESGMAAAGMGGPGAGGMGPIDNPIMLLKQYGALPPEGVV